MTAHLELIDADQALKAGVDGIEHITSFGTSLADPDMAERFREKVDRENDARQEWRYRLWASLELDHSLRVQPLLNLIGQRRTFVSPTLGIFEKRNGDEDTAPFQVQGFENMLRFTGLCHQAGAVVVVGSHTWVPHADYGWAFQREMELLGECGLTPLEVISAATLNNAEFLGCSDRLGSVTPGKLADLILVDGNPLEDMRAMYKVEHVMLNGAWVVGNHATVEKKTGRIKPYSRNPRYWEYDGKPVLLLGGTKDDSLFQIPHLEEHLDELANVRGNYVRNTMSDRPDHDFEVYPFKQLANGKYDLNQWNDKYWSRFENFLSWTHERDIIVQIEVWDRFDYSDHSGNVRWAKHPYNPNNNVNYTSEQSGLAVSYTKHHPSRDRQPFFHTVPEIANNQVLLVYQQRFVDKMLAHSLQYPHVLYCMDNETSSSPEWGLFWSRHIQRRAREAGVSVQTTEMWDRNHRKPKVWEDPLLQRTFDNADTYSFVDFSQNNSQSGQLHWDNLQWARTRTNESLRPINNVKIYGGPANRSYTATAEQAIRRFWRNIIGGAASSRFHRPDSGIGLSDEAKTHIKSMRILASELDIFNCTPDKNSKLLSNRDDDEAYLTFIPGRQYAIYFPHGGSVDLNLEEAAESFTMKWLDIVNNGWTEQKTVHGGTRLTLTSPGKGQWIVLIETADNH